MNIYQKMLAATDKITKVAKNLSVGVGQNQYKAVGEADVLEAVKPVEVELGIYSYPLSREIIDSNAFITTAEYQGKKTEKTNLFMRIKTIYRFINTENPEEFIDITTYGDGVDTQDKAPGKAMTYSDKYALLKAYKIETGEDPDQHASEELGKGAKSIKSEKKEEPKKEIVPQIDPKTLERARILKIDPVKVAAYNKISIDDLTTEIMEAAIKQKTEALAKMKAEKEAREAGSEN